MSRFRFNFWLDCARDDDLLLAETIDALKRTRSFSSAIRDGLNLIVDLRQGKTDLLFRLFPWVADALKGKTEDIASLKHEIERLQTLIIQSNNQPSLAPKAIGDSANLPTIFAKDDKKENGMDTRRSFAAGMGNLFDDEDDELIILDKPARSTASRNFLSAVATIASS